MVFNCLFKLLSATLSWVITATIDDLRCLRFWSKKYECSLRGRPKLQSSHYQNKHLIRTLFERHSMLLWSITTDFCCAFGCSNKRKTGSKSNISYYRIPFGTDPESLSLRKRWIAAIRRENWTDDQIDNSRICSKHLICDKSKETLLVSRSLVFLFVSVVF